MGPLIDHRVEAVAGRPYESHSEPARLPVLPVYHLIVVGRYEAHPGGEAQSLAYLNIPRVNAYIGGAEPGGLVSNTGTNWLKMLAPAFGRQVSAPPVRAIRFGLDGGTPIRAPTCGEG